MNLYLILYHPQRDGYDPGRIVIAPSAADALAAAEDRPFPPTIIELGTANPALPTGVLLHITEAGMSDTMFDFWTQHKARSAD